MDSKSYRLDRFIQKTKDIPVKRVRHLIAQRRVLVDGQLATSIHQQINQFTHVTLDGQCLKDEKPLYVMLNKPKGIVSATKDVQHKTVIDLLPSDLQDKLHIVGRLDFNSTGLILLTNDGRWSKAINNPATKLPKYYRVTVDKPLEPHLIDAFLKGFYFAYEQVTTQPAALAIIAPFVAEVTLTEGRYHQIKRMFGHFQIEVLTLHRFAVGNLHLDTTLKEGEHRVLSEEEASATLGDLATR
ncbi:MAG TPA: pseudouridine synthase [Marinagarivorans sp.]